ncbi:CD99 molecule isoform X2 [Electrophorus electricus]|uniref:CD99 molecule isoform X2 n=1 Tax=Electrophorus electricus TaxID=8005 RepID=UPI0015CFD1BE|nr:CD99 molecule isoform X2 [Electrophorus electricus]
MTSYLWILVLVYLAGATAQDLNLGDALDDTTTPPKPDVKQPKQGSDDFNLNDAIDSDTPNEPNKPPPAPPKPADPKKPLGGDGFSNDDLLDVVGDEYKPDPGRGHGGRASDPGYDTTGDDTDQSQDLNQLWLQLLRLLGDNVPECLHAWTDNFRQVLGSVLEMMLDFLDPAEGEQLS